MFKCDKCGRVKEDLPTIEERHPYGDTYASEYFTDANCYCGGEFEEAYFCTNCKEYRLEEEMAGNAICNECAEDLITNENIKEFFNDNPDYLEEFLSWKGF